MSRFLLPDTRGNKSLTATLFVIGFVVCCIKLLMSGIAINEQIKFDTFSGVDFASAIVALGGIYNIRRKWNPEHFSETKNETV